MFSSSGCVPTIVSTPGGSLGQQCLLKAGQNRLRGARLSSPRLRGEDDAALRKSRAPLGEGRFHRLRLAERSPYPTFSPRAGRRSERPRVPEVVASSGRIKPAPFRHGIVRSEGALLRASRADGGRSAIIRGTLTPDPARMEADGTVRVYRVSHVVRGEFANLLRQIHSNPLPLCRSPARHCDIIGKKLIGAFSNAE
jgi:hypothetical protein